MDHILSIGPENQNTRILVGAMPLAHWVSLDKLQLFSNLTDSQNPEEHLTYRFPNGIWLSRPEWSPGISILIIVSSRFLWLLTSINHLHHSFLLCKILLARITQRTRACGTAAHHPQGMGAKLIAQFSNTLQPINSMAYVFCSAWPC